ncbi:nuclear transport factor 2 family protein [Mucilaginibacter sp. dw_454]|uniref:nuclear transport factor 2 family protein n=1 Tax=Mucilaginibacter sp. dw_454 TaxID=2720079 RepID=UPI001BD2AC48|nr:nuclear transport factor 2 family protein [Mucilaginibacter sp. dw_454]
MKNIEDIAARLITLCAERQFVQAYQELFAEEAVSIDPNYKNEPLTGLKNLIEREEKFLASVDLHEISLSAPILAGTYFSVAFYMGFTPAGQERKSFKEIAVYKVDGGKIVSQQFFVG